jgi:DNA invertase Pin-like site-specific DNA recombinase
MATAVYLRVSTNQQDTRSQEADLKAWAAQQEASGETVRWYRDKATGTNFNRKDWQRLNHRAQFSCIDEICTG